MTGNVSQENRRKIALELARSHRLHLTRELDKSPDLLSETDAEGVCFEDRTRLQLDELSRLFPELLSEPTEDATENIMESWYESTARRSDLPSYFQVVFNIQNAVFLERLRYMLDSGEESRIQLMETATGIMRRERASGRGWSFPYLIQTESAMRRLIERRFRRMKYERMEDVNILADEQENAVLTAWFTYYHELALVERVRSDNLLGNILPRAVAEDLKRKGLSEPIQYDSATVVFTDFVGFTESASRLKPIELIEDLDRLFRAFDRILRARGLEKLKTIGDSYMFAGGLPNPDPEHARKCVLAALEIRDYVKAQKIIRPNMWPIRIGIHSGPLIAGIIGVNKFSYDIWGDTVNIASRMESGGEQGRINISEMTWSLVKDFFQCEERGYQEIKNRGKYKMYFVTGERES